MESSEANKYTPEYFRQVKALSRRRLAERGGKELRVRLEASGLALLAELRERNPELKTDAEAIVWALGVARLEPLPRKGVQGVTEATGDA